MHNETFTRHARPTSSAAEGHYNNHLKWHFPICPKERQQGKEKKPSIFLFREMRLVRLELANQEHIHKLNNKASSVDPPRPGRVRGQEYSCWRFLLNRHRS